MRLFTQREIAYRTGYLDGVVRCGWAPRGGPWFLYAIGYAVGRSQPGLEGW